ncbi:endoglycoceramidase-like isoform X2 [Dysidea avara]|uniref:endoglycoceramidase-like isoform X2 n=1 Tax=Dysidea avara TaxID=196820 RepID=UPI00332E0A63
MASFWLPLLPVLLAISVESVDILQVDVNRNRVVDASDRERYFHGVNVVVKGPPWIPIVDKFDPDWSFSKEDMQALQKLGLNGIRLGMMWPGVEPQRGQYNETYLTMMKDLVDMAGQYGIYSLLDCHQDVLSEKFCGEGVPDWAVYTGNAPGFPFPLGGAAPYDYDPKTGYPKPEDCAKFDWTSYQFSAATSAAYQSIYNNTNGLLTSMAEFWGKVASTFSDNKFVLGYEIINEPWAGDIFADPTLLLPTVADKKNLANAYDVVNHEIRKYDDQHCVYFEGVTWGYLSDGFEEVPGGTAYCNRSVLSYHFYEPPQSWLGWEYKPYVCITGCGRSLWYPNGTMNMPVAKALSRTYAQAIAGNGVEMTFNHITSEFKLHYKIYESCTSNLTEIYMNEELHYPRGYTATVTPKDIVTWHTPHDNMFHVEHDTTKLKPGASITVHIVSR